MDILFHIYIFPYIGNVIVPTDFHIFPKRKTCKNGLPLCQGLDDLRWFLIISLKSQKTVAAKWDLEDNFPSEHGGNSWTKG